MRYYSGDLSYRKRVCSDERGFQGHDDVQDQKGDFRYPK